MAEIDGSSTVSLLERMKEKVEQDEALAEAYGDIANDSKSIDDELNAVIDTTEVSAESDLDKLKKQLGMSDDSKES
jgi:phage shock protein A